MITLFFQRAAVVGAATLEVELNYSAQEAARDLRFEKYSSP